MEALLTSTVTVALAEIGDKTQLLSLLLTLRFRNKAGIVAGILVATLINHALSALLGNWLSQYLTAQWGQILIGASFIILGLWLLIPDKEDDDVPRFDHWGAFLVSLVLFFLAEIGDKTQIATVVLGAQYNSILLVTLGTTIGMLLANVPVVYAGEALMRKLPLKAAHIGAAVVFSLVGLSIIWRSLG